jgi:nickel-dependent lactate racemase
MKVKLAYGKNGIVADIPSKNIVAVLQPKEAAAVPDEAREIERALRTPISKKVIPKLVQRDSTVAIVVSDITRPVPSHFIVPAIAKTLNRAGVRDEQIKIIVACGLHRENMTEELRRMLGSESVDRFKVINHNAERSPIKKVGTTSKGTPFWVSESFLSSDFKILTGHVEPHFFAGFTGGRKSVLPGISGLETIKINHSAKNLDHPKATFGVLEGNPVHEDMVEGARMAGADFIVNVAVNSQGKVTRAAAGELVKAHLDLVDFVKGQCFVSLPKPADIVLTTNSGYPLDQNLYQAVKGMWTAEPIIKPGGTVIIAAECKEGIGHGAFKDMLKKGMSPSEMLELIRRPNFFMVDQWQVQILAKLMLKAEIVVVSSIPRGEVESIGFKTAESVDVAVKAALRKHGEDAKIAVLPTGPMVIPQLQEN